MKLALFDIDGTLTRHSTEQAFGRFLARRGLLGPRQVAGFVRLGLSSLPKTRRQTLKKNKGYLAGLTVADVERLAGEFVAEKVLQRLVPAVLARLREHRRQGDHVVLVSGTLDAIARSLAAQLDAHRGLGTLCVTENGRFVAALPRMHPFGTEKRVQAERLAAEVGLDARDVVAYANATDDLELLRYAGTPVAVLPDRGLARVALAEGWEVIDDKTIGEVAARG